MDEKDQEFTCDENFWEDVDNIRAMLDQEQENSLYPDGSLTFEDIKPREDSPSGAMQWNRAPAPQSAAAERAAVRPETQPGIKKPREKKAGEKKPRPMKKRSGKGLIAALYGILILELFAIYEIGSQWYLWMQ